MSQASMMEKLKVADIKAEDLDELVHEVFSKKASKVNNEGMQTQVVVLRGEIGEDEILSRFGLIA